MRITICAVGRLRAGPESALIDDYLGRFGRTGRALGFGKAEIREVVPKASGMAAEAAGLFAACPDGAITVALDERGELLDSPAFADRLGAWRDTGTRDLVFFIGGADGLDPALRSGVSARLSLGQMVWPHMLVRVMLSEQLYRAASILAGSPYHRA